MIRLKFTAVNQMILNEILNALFLSHCKSSVKVWQWNYAYIAPKSEIEFRTRIIFTVKIAYVQTQDSKVVKKLKVS